MITQARMSILAKAYADLARLEQRSKFIVDGDLIKIANLHIFKLFPHTFSDIRNCKLRSCSNVFHFVTSF